MKEANEEQLEKINFEEGKPNINQQEIFNSQHKSAEKNNILSDFINFVYGN